MRQPSSLSSASGLSVAAVILFVAALAVVLYPTAKKNQGQVAVLAQHTPGWSNEIARLETGDLVRLTNSTVWIVAKKVDGRFFLRGANDVELVTKLCSNKELAGELREVATSSMLMDYNRLCKLFVSQCYHHGSDQEK
ncbi:MAG: hypothetical protein V4481_03705 [Patescibacteria group bacterium]